MSRRDEAAPESPTGESAEEYFGPRFLARLHTRLHSNPVTGALTKVVVTLAGVVVMLAGVVMMVTPGPGIVALVLGLAILSTEWRWADRWLDFARAKAAAAAEVARTMDPAVRRRRILLATGVLVGVVALVVGALQVWGWPGVAVELWDDLQARASFVPDLPGMP
ncbi:PGPGW domain-containing protein [Nocardioides yefusunii]|uniref:PGPGW domain-containing protein n=1 Tax=Nocardioides yefusunii TaxID=2500546 RepID=A0ABW1QSM7_9ACTN|nr:PGPGW domain-containing protein [Nocardioides yefusunii]